VIPGSILQGFGPRWREAKYNENRVFRHKTAAAAWQNGFRLNHLLGKFVTLRNNGIFPPINELKPPYQPNNNRKYAGCENTKCGPTCRRAMPPPHADEVIE
jgi:hypothetical protein